MPKNAKKLPNFRNHKIENYYYFLGEDVWVKMLFTVFELLPSKVTRELTLEEKGDVVKVARDKSWGRIPWHIPERYQGTCSALVLFWPRYKE
jgi:hypothetical protein